MQISLHQPTDLEQLQQAIGSERDAQQRDRYRAAYLAIQGQQNKVIQQTLGRSKGFVERWVYAYRDHGLAGLKALRRGGSKGRLSLNQQQRFIARFTAGPTDADGGRCTLRGDDGVRILRQEFGVNYTLSGVYKLLHRHNLACLKPRPRHRKNDPQAMLQWLEQAPLLSSGCAKDSKNTCKSKSGSRTKLVSVSKAR